MGGDLCVYALKEAVWQGKPEVDSVSYLRPHYQLELIRYTVTT